MSGGRVEGAAVVTGASSGIGLAIAQALSAAGATVAITARPSERLEAALATLPGPAMAVPADITAPDAVVQVLEAATARFGPVRTVVANAGIYLANKPWDNDPAEIEQLVSTNVTAAVLTVRAAIAEMLPRRFGDVIVTSSVSGYQAIPWEPIYSASKHALRSFVHGTRRQLVGTGIRLGAIAPGVVLTGLWQVADDKSGAPARQRTGLSSEDVAEAVMFMLTRPRHVTVRDLVLLPSDQDI